jgi:hypothetical protein
MPTPKEQFIAGNHRVAHEKWTDTAAAKTAVEAALAQFVYLQTNEGDPMACTKAHNQLIGAKAVLGILMDLHLAEKPVTREKFPSLRPPS